MNSQYKIVPLRKYPANDVHISHSVYTMRGSLSLTSNGADDPEGTCSTNVLVHGAVGIYLLQTGHSLNVVLVATFHEDVPTKIEEVQRSTCRRGHDELRCSSAELNLQPDDKLYNEPHPPSMNLKLY